MMLPILLKLFQIDYLLISFQSIVFIIQWPIKNLQCIRAILVIIINLDRDFAVFFPMPYYRFRKNVANSVISAIPFCYTIVENYILFGACEYKLRIPEGCVLLICSTNECYITYAIWFEAVTHILIAIVSSALVLKLFLLNRCLMKSQGEYLEKANFLALIDTFMIIIFNIIPALIIAKNQQTMQLEEFGNLLTFGKVTGYALEAFLVYKTLKKVQATTSNVVVFNVKNSH